MRATDRNYVLSSWLRSYAGRSGDAMQYVEHREFVRDYAVVVRALLARSQVIVASMREEPDVIVGWAAVEGDLLHYVHTKPRWRQLGVARWLLKDFAALPVVYTHRTNDATKCPIPSGWVYRRYRIWPAEQEEAA